LFLIINFSFYKKALTNSKSDSRVNESLAVNIWLEQTCLNFTNALAYYIKNLIEQSRVFCRIVSTEVNKPEINQKWGDVEREKTVNIWLKWAVVNLEGRKKKRERDEEKERKGDGEEEKRQSEI
jgi:hypothetical protein